MSGLNPYTEIINRVLVVDDEPLIRKILVKYLSEQNYSVTSAENGETALERLSEAPFDLVLTDLKMPKMGGGKLLSIMAEKYPEIPKIVLTGHGTNDDIILALKTGAYDFLTKPLTDFNILHHSINRALERKRLNDERKEYFNQLNHINEVVSMLNRGKSTEEIFDSLNLTLKKIIPFSRLTLALIDIDRELFEIKFCRSDKDIILTTGTVIQLKESPLRFVAEEKKVLYIDLLGEYIKQYPESITAELLFREGMASALVLPLIVSDRVRGFLILASIEKRAYQKEHISFLESISGQISFSIERGELLDEIELHTKNLESIVEKRTQEIVKTQRTMIFALSKLAETRDPETGEHLERIRNYSVLLAQILKYEGSQKDITNQYIRDLYDSSILHDIGKVGIPDGILLKEGFLNEDEYEIMKSHTVIGYEALKSASKDLGEDSFLSMAMDIVLFHQERWDGSGYPYGLKGEEIPLSARIVALVDVYDALTSKRPYKEPFTHERTLEMLQEESEKYDPELLKIFLENGEEFNKIRGLYQ